VGVSGTIHYRDGTSQSLGIDTFTRAPEEALRMLAAATVTLALAMLVLRAT
jgi:hypothetical protein